MNMIYLFLKTDRAGNF